MRFSYKTTYKIRFNFLYLFMLVSAVVTTAIALLKDEAYAEKPVYEKSPARIVSLAPIITEMLIELGESEKIVGKTSYCKLPEGTSEVPDVGGYLDTSIEKVVSLKPDIVFSMKGASRTPEKLRALGIPVIEISNESVSAIQKSFVEIAAILNKEEKANALLKKSSDSFEAQKSEVKEKGFLGKSFLVLLDEGTSFRKRFYAASPHSFYGDLLSQLGLKNALTSELLYAPLGMEGIISLQPEVVFVLRERKDESIEAALRKSFSSYRLIIIYGVSAQLPGIGYAEISSAFIRAMKAEL